MENKRIISAHCRGYFFDFKNLIIVNHIKNKNFGNKYNFLFKL